MYEICALQFKGVSLIFFWRANQRVFARILFIFGEAPTDLHQGHWFDPDRWQKTIGKKPRPCDGANRRDQSKLFATDGAPINTDERTPMTENVIWPPTPSWARVQRWRERATDA